MDLKVRFDIESLERLMEVKFNEDFVDNIVRDVISDLKLEHTNL